jgi:hypothetical protein
MLSGRLITSPRTERGGRLTRMARGMEWWAWYWEEKLKFLLPSSQWLLWGQGLWTSLSHSLTPGVLFCLCFFPAAFHLFLFSVHFSVCFYLFLNGLDISEPFKNISVKKRRGRYCNIRTEEKAFHLRRIPGSAWSEEKVKSLEVNELSGRKRRFLLVKERTWSRPFYCFQS